MAVFQQFLGVFVATLPLMGVIGWAAFAQNQRLGRIETQLDLLGIDLKALGVRSNVTRNENHRFGNSHG